MATKVEECVHHFVVEPKPRSGKYNGECKKCKLKKQFPAVIDDGSNRSWRHSRPKKKS